MSMFSKGALTSLLKPNYDSNFIEAGLKLRLNWTPVGFELSSLTKSDLELKLDLSITFNTT